MNIVWQREARDDVVTIITYILADNPEAAGRIYQAIHHHVSRLADFPRSGRAGQVERTRELVIPGLPYVITYNIKGQEIWILAVMHTSRKWPKNFTNQE